MGYMAQVRRHRSPVEPFLEDQSSRMPSLTKEQFYRELNLFRSLDYLTVDPKVVGCFQGPKVSGYAEWIVSYFFTNFGWLICRLDFSLQGSIFRKRKRGGDNFNTPKQKSTLSNNMWFRRVWSYKSLSAISINKSGKRQLIITLQEFFVRSTLVNFLP